MKVSWRICYQLAILLFHILPLIMLLYNSAHKYLKLHLIPLKFGYCIHQIAHYIIPH